MPIKAAFTSTLQTQFRWMPFRYIMNATFLLGMQSTVRASTASLLGVCLLSLVGLSPLPIQVWAWKDQGFVAAALPPATLAPVEALQASDLEGNGSIERLALAAGVLTITQNGSIAWRSPQAWQVAQAAITDLNHDGRPEVTLLVWRPFAPWPIDRYLPHPGRITSFHDANGQSCHVILIGWKGGAFREVWAGSALAEPVKAFQVASLQRLHRRQGCRWKGRSDKALVFPRPHLDGQWGKAHQGQQAYAKQTRGRSSHG